MPTSLSSCPGTGRIWSDDEAEQPSRHRSWRRPAGHHRPGVAVVRDLAARAGCQGRPGLLARLVDLRDLQVVLLEDIERLLLDAPLREQALAVPEVLDPGQRPPRGAEVGEDPRGDAAKEWNPLEHRHLVPVHACLVLLTPPGLCVGVVPLQRPGAEL